MKKLIFAFLIIMAFFELQAQNNANNSATIRQQMAKIRQSTNWDDPVAAKKANEEIQKLAKQMTGGKSLPIELNNQPPDPNAKQKNVDFEVKSVATQENIVAIADRYFKRSYKAMDVFARSTFDQDYKTAEKAEFSFEAVRKLTGIGGVLITFGNDHNTACVYLASAVKLAPTDTLSINNFGGYLRAIDSTEVSVPVLLYANKLFSGSPVIHTQLGNSYFELNDFAKAESNYKEALKYNPDFGQAHSALCELYLQQGRIQDAITELFAGVKGMGCSYADASKKFANVQQQYGNSSGKSEADTKESFWNEIKKNVAPSKGASQPGSGLGRVKMPVFPDCKKVEDWLEGGGYSNAVLAYQDFGNYDMSFIRQFQNVQNQLPSLPPDAILRDYPNERIALDCITEMFFGYSELESEKYTKSINEISQRVNDAKELYLKKFTEFAKDGLTCAMGCGGNDKCLKECHRIFCAKECPNANNFNEKLKQAYNDYRTLFSQHTSKQIKFLNDLYSFTDPWIGKIYSPYWSRIYAYEIKRVALSIVGNCFAAYPQLFQMPAHNDCGTDCSPYAMPFVEKPDDVNKEDPEANSCPENSKLKISILICEIGLDCESIEVGCTAGVSGSLKRNFKRKSTTVFIGVGLKMSLGVVSAGAKAGVAITADQNWEVEDVGGKMDLSVSAGVGAASVGASSSGSYTVMTGMKAKVGIVGAGKLK